MTLTEEESSNVERGRFAAFIADRAGVERDHRDTHIVNAKARTDNAAMNIHAKGAASMTICAGVICAPDTAQPRSRRARATRYRSELS